jgi:ribosome-associated toxin RatA of RatAB toxin-antitoxin module
MTRIEASRAYDAPADVVWAVVTDPDVYAEVAPNLSSVEILDGADAGAGMVRECVDTRGNEWTESCDYWNAGRGFGVVVDVETSAFHRPWFSRFEGRWELTERDGEVLVTVRFDFDAKYGPLGGILTRYLQYRTPPLVEAIFDGWHAELATRLAERGAQDESSTPSASETHRNQLYR